MKRLALVAAALVLAPVAARADVISLRAEAHGGGMFGRGIKGDQQDDAFFQASPNGVYGALVGLEFLWVDLWIQHHQYTDGDRLTTWTQFSTGLDMQIPVGEAGPPDADGKRGRPKTYVELGLYGGFGVGTGQQVDPPLDNSEITDKAFTLSVDFAFGKRINSIMDIGVRVPVTGGYYFKSGNGAVANDLSTHYSSIHAEALLYLRFNVKLR
jgi:hypothetical protein